MSSESIIVAYSIHFQHSATAPVVRGLDEVAYRSFMNIKLHRLVSGYVKAYWSHVYVF